MERTDNWNINAADMMIPRHILSEDYNLVDILLIYGEIDAATVMIQHGAHFNKDMLRGLVVLARTSNALKDFAVKYMDQEEDQAKILEYAILRRDIYLMRNVFQQYSHFEINVDVANAISTEEVVHKINNSSLLTEFLDMICANSSVLSHGMERYGFNMYPTFFDRCHNITYGYQVDINRLLLLTVLQLADPARLLKYEHVVKSMQNGEIYHKLEQVRTHELLDFNNLHTMEDINDQQSCCIG